MGLIVRSLAAKHRVTVEAGQPVPAAKPRKSSGLMYAALEADRAKLKKVRSNKRKAEAKAGMVGKYADYLTGLINSDQGGHSEILVTVCIWALDANQYRYFISLAEYALKHGMQSPQGFSRSLPEVLTEELSDRVIGSCSPALLLGYLQQIEALTREADRVDQVTAKLYKALGLAQIATDKAAALAAFRVSLEHGGQVKRFINKLSKEG